MDAREDDKGVAASSVEWSAAREGSGVRDSREASIAGPAVGGTREYECSDTRPRYRIKRAPSIDVASVAANDGWERSPSPRIIGTRRDRAASCDRPSPRPTTRPRHRSPTPCGGNIIITPASLLPGILRRRQRSISPPAGTPVRSHQRLRFTFTENTQNRRALVPRRKNLAVQGRSPRPSENAPTLSEITANARAWSNRAEARVTGAQLVSIPQVVNGLGGRHCLPSTCQRAGIGTTRRRSPSPMKVEGGHIHISKRRKRRRRHTCITGGVCLRRRRGSIPSRVRRGRGGEVAPTENGRTRDGPSHSPLLMNEAVPASQNALRQPEAPPSRGFFAGPHLKGPSRVIRLSVPAPVSIVCHRTRH